MNAFTELRFSAYDLSRIVLLVLIWVGAMILFGFLFWARTRFGWGWEASGEISAIVMDIAMILCFLIMVLSVLPAFRTLGLYSSEEAMMRVGLINLVVIFLVVWLSIARWLVWAFPLRGISKAKQA